MSEKADSILPCQLNKIGLPVALLLCFNEIAKAFFQAARQVVQDSGIGAGARVYILADRV